MNVLETCLIVDQDGRASIVPTGRMLADDTGTRHRRRRGYSLDMSTTDEITPHPPPEHQILYSASESKSSINTNTSSDVIPSNSSSYKFQCKNVSPNLHIIVKTDVDHIESHCETCTEADDDDVTDRIIPE